MLFLNPHQRAEPISSHYLSFFSRKQKETLHSFGSLAPLSPSTLPLAQRLFRPHPTPHPLRLPLLTEIRLGDPAIPLQAVLPGQSRRTTNVHSPAAHTRQRVLLGQHMQIPQRQTSSHLHATVLSSALSRQPNRSRHFQVPKDGNTSLSIDSCGIHSRSIRRATAANTQQLNLCDDEAVAAPMLPHNTVKMSQALQIQDLLWGALAPHTGVPLIIALDKANNTTTGVTRKRLFVVAGIV